MIESWGLAKIRQVRALVVRGGATDYHDHGGSHWIHNHIATPTLSGIHALKFRLGGLGGVQERAAMICFMASGESRFTIASIFDTSGGRTTF